MATQDLPSTKPYLIRAIHEWCADNGFTPYLGVAVDASVDVPLAYVTNNQIVLNVSYGATDVLKMGNDLITFKGRFGGQVKELMVPVARVVAIYAKENGQGMAFEASETVLDSVPSDVHGATSPAPVIALVKRDAALPQRDDGVSGTSVEPEPPGPGAGGGGSGLRRIK